MTMFFVAWVVGFITGIFMVPEKILNDPDGVFLFHKNITYEYETICSCETGGSLAFIKAVKWVYVVFIAYLIVYLFVKSSFFLSMTNNRRRKR